MCNTESNNAYYLISFWYIFINIKADMDFYIKKKKLYKFLNEN